MKNPQELIGKKVRGFKFESNQNVGYSKLLDNQIGKVGVIKKVYDDNTVRVLFEGKINFFYPADQIEAHLVEDETFTFNANHNKMKLVDEIPTLSDGVMMLVSDSGNIWFERKIYFKYNDRYITILNGIFQNWTHAKPLEPTKEEQLTAILGSSDKVSEIMELFKN